MNATATTWHPFCDAARLATPASDKVAADGYRDGLEGRDRLALIEDGADRIVYRTALASGQLDRETAERDEIATRKTISKSGSRIYLAHKPADPPCILEGAEADWWLAAYFEELAYAVDCDPEDAAKELWAIEREIFVAEGAEAHRIAVARGADDEAPRMDGNPYDESSPEGEAWTDGWLRADEPGRQGRMGDRERRLAQDRANKARRDGQILAEPISCIPGWKAWVRGYEERYASSWGATEAEAVAALLDWIECVDDGTEWTDEITAGVAAARERYGLAVAIESEIPPGENEDADDSAISFDFQGELDGHCAGGDLESWPDAEDRWAREQIRDERP